MPMNKQRISNMNEFRKFRPRRKFAFNHTTRIRRAVAGSHPSGTLPSCMETGTPLMMNTQTVVVAQPGLARDSAAMCVYFLECRAKHIGVQVPHRGS